MVHYTYFFGEVFESYSVLQCYSRILNNAAAVMQADISDIYLLAKSTKGVFVNIALQEPFGLTLIEAAVHGAPIVATRHGGPVDIIATLRVRPPVSCKLNPLNGIEGLA